MKKLLLITGIVLLPLYLMNAANQVLNPQQTIQRMQDNGDKEFLKKNFEAAKKVYEDILKYIKENRVNVSRKILRDIQADITDINNIPDFQNIEKILKEAEEFFSGNKNLEGIKSLQNALKLMKTHEAKLSSYRNLAFFKQGGYIPYLIGNKIQSARTRGAFMAEAARKSIIITELKNITGNPNDAFYSQALPRSIQSVLNRQGGYTINKIDDFQQQIANMEQQAVLNFFRTKNIELVVFGDFKIDDKKNIVINVTVYDSFTGNNVANAIVEGKADNEIFDAVDKISQKMDTALIDYSRNSFFQTIVLKLTGQNQIETTRIIRSQGIFGYDKFTAEIQNTMTTRYQLEQTQNNAQAQKTWTEKGASEFYLEKAHKIVEIEKQFKDALDPRGKPFVDITENEERVINSYKTIIKVEEIEKLISERKFDEAERLIDAADREIERLAEKFPHFRFAARNARRSYYSKVISLRQHKGFQFQIHVKFGYYFPMGKYDEKVKMRYPFGGLEFRFPIVRFTPWFHLNMGVETGIWGVNSRAQEPDSFNPTSPIYEQVYRIYTIPLIGNIFLKFLPLKWLHLTTSFGIGVAFHRLDATNERDAITPDNRWSDIAIKTSIFLKVSFELQFKITTGFGISTQFSYMYSGPNNFHKDKAFIEGAGTTPFNTLLNSVLHRESLSMWMISAGVFFAF